MPLTRPTPVPRHLVPFDGSFALDELSTAPPDGEAGKKKHELEEELQACVEELYDLQRVLYADERYAVLTVFQARDAAGKDSTIRHVFSGVNPHGFRVHAFGPPSELELRHDFLWRCTQRLPERGRIGIFNRSHYEEVLIVRLKPELLRAQHLPHVDPSTLWEERMASIRAWERHLASNGVAIVKFFLHVSKEEQRKRLLARIERPEKNWKFRLGDLDDRDRWTEYSHVYEEAIRETSRDFAPWYAVPADDKPYMRLAVARVMLATLKGLQLRFPELPEDQRGALAEGRRRLEKGD